MPPRRGDGLRLRWLPFGRRHEKYPTEAPRIAGSLRFSSWEHQESCAQQSKNDAVSVPFALFRLGICSFVSGKRYSLRAASLCFQATVRGSWLRSIFLRNENNHCKSGLPASKTALFSVSCVQAGSICEWEGCSFRSVLICSLL